MPKVRIDSELHDVFRRLGGDQQDAATKKTFDTMKDVFVLAMVLGVKSGMRTPIERSRDIFDDDVFKARDWNIIHAIALSESNKIEEVENEGEILRIAQEYANTGIRILRDRVEFREVAQSVAHLLLEEQSS